VGQETEETKMTKDLPRTVVPQSCICTLPKSVYGLMYAISYIFLLLTGKPRNYRNLHGGSNKMSNVITCVRKPNGHGVVQRAALSFAIF
jgi:hypothetical protein